MMKLEYTDDCPDDFHTPNFQNVPAAKLAAHFPCPLEVSQCAPLAGQVALACLNGSCCCTVHGRHARNWTCPTTRLECALDM